MRKRLVLLWTPFVLAMALIFPATTAAGSAGRIGFVSGYCSGDNTVNATFKIVKSSGYYATHITMTVTGQGRHGGVWTNEYNLGTFTKNVDTSAKATMQRSFWYDPGHDGRHRIKVVGKIWDGGSLIAKGKATSPYCV